MTTGAKCPCRGLEGWRHTAWPEPAGLGGGDAGERLRGGRGWSTKGCPLLCPGQIAEVGGAGHPSQILVSEGPAGQRSCTQEAWGRRFRPRLSTQPAGVSRVLGALWWHSRGDSRAQTAWPLTLVLALLGAVRPQSREQAASSIPPRACDMRDRSAGRTATCSGGKHHRTHARQQEHAFRV